MLVLLTKLVSPATVNLHFEAFLICAHMCKLFHLGTFHTSIQYDVFSYNCAQYINSCICGYCIRTVRCTYTVKNQFCLMFIIAVTSDVSIKIGY